MSKLDIYDVTIELRSDMCCGTGESNGVAVDRVTALDSNGLPIIPGKRLKGLLREQAEIVDEEYVSSLFGESENNCAGKLRFSDAHLIGSSRITEQMNEPDLEITPAKVTKVYTTTRSGTRIEDDGVAADHSLRTIQVVKRCNSNGDPTKFVCTIEGENLTDKEKPALGRAVKCLRSIGMNKSRGLGEVVCSGNWRQIKINDADSTNEVSGDAPRSIGYRITLRSPAVMQGGPDGSLDYIPGSMLQGIFARAFCEENEEIFESHVLRNTRFSNAYLELAANQGETSAPSEPIPLTYKTKKNALGKTGLPLYDASTCELNVQSSDGTVTQQVPINGYGALIEGNFVVANVAESFSFHSSRPSSAQGKQFYSMKSLDAGQSFCGTITAVPGALASFQKVVNNRGGRFVIGNAASGGYGACNLELFELSEPSSISLASGDHVAIRFVSDVVFVDKRGANSSDIGAFAQHLSENALLGFSFNASMDAGADACKAHVKISTVGGYNSHWRLPKRQYIAFKKGSTLVVKVTSCPDDKVDATVWVGHLQTEGFGELRIEKVENQSERTYSKGIPAQHAEQYESSHADDADKAADKAFEAFKCELAFVDACEHAEFEARSKANEYFRESSSSKSSAMRIGSLFSTALKSSEEQTLDKVFESAVNENFTNDATLKDACSQIVDKYRNLEKDYPLSDFQKHLLFSKYMQEYLSQIKQIYSMREGGEHE